jgi:hypothetical protein
MNRNAEITAAAASAKASGARGSRSRRADERRPPSVPVPALFSCRPTSPSPGIASSQVPKRVRGKRAPARCRSWPPTPPADGGLHRPADGGRQMRAGSCSGPPSTAAGGGLRFWIAARCRAVASEGIERMHIRNALPTDAAAACRCVRHSIAELCRPGSLRTCGAACPAARPKSGEVDCRRPRGCCRQQHGDRRTAAILRCAPCTRAVPGVTRSLAATELAGERRRLALSVWR